jgi:phage-related protein
MELRVRPLRRVGSSKKDLKCMPDSVQDTFGFAFFLAQTGRTHPSAKPLKGFGSAGVVEAVEDYVSGTYRAVYTARFANAVYVLHCFQKKSKTGIATPKAELEMIKQRLKAAEADSKGTIQ